MGQRARRVRWAFAGIVLAAVGVRSVLHARALDAADRTQTKLAPFYDSGCVTVLEKADRPARLSCGGQGVRIDSIAAHVTPGEEFFLLFAVCLNPDTAAASRFVVDAFTADGRPLGSSRPIVSYRQRPRFGEPARHGEKGPPGISLPLVVALRRPRPGEP